MTTLRVSRTYYPVTTLGPGRRLGIWLQGCSLGCRGCMSRDTWDPAGGTAVEVGELCTRWRAALNDGATGVTISGGEPLQQAPALGELLDCLTEISSATHDVLVYTGYTEAELTGARRRAVARADVLITGRYDVARPTTLRWRGSANQHLVLNTELGRTRYAEFVDATAPPDATIQVHADESGIRLIGVPAPGTLRNLDRDLRDLGLPAPDTTWHRNHRLGS